MRAHARISRRTCFVQDGAPLLFVSSSSGCPVGTAGCIYKRAKIFTSDQCGFGADRLCLKEHDWTSVNAFQYVSSSQHPVQSKAIIFTLTHLPSLSRFPCLLGVVQLQALVPPVDPDARGFTLPVGGNTALLIPRSLDACLPAICCYLMHAFLPFAVI